MKNAYNIGAAVLLAMLAGPAFAQNAQPKNDPAKFFGNNQYHIGFSLGIASPTVPLLINESTITTDGDTSNRSFAQSPAQGGIQAGLSFHPLVNDNVSIGVLGSGTYTRGLISLVGKDLSIATEYGTASAVEKCTGFNYQYGLEAAVGFPKIKLLTAYNKLHYRTDFSRKSEAGGAIGDTSSTQRANPNYSANRFEIGIRFGKMRHTCIDLLYGIESFTDEDGSRKTFPVYKLAINKPHGISICAQYGKGIAFGSNKYEWKSESAQEKSSLYLSVGLNINLSIFSKY